MCLLSIGGEETGNLSQGCGVVRRVGREIRLVLCVDEDSSCRTTTGDLELLIEIFSEYTCVVEPTNESSSEIATEVYHMLL